MAEIYAYAANCEDFTNFGLVGALDYYDAKYTTADGEMPELEFKHPLDAEGRYKALQKFNCLMTDVPMPIMPEIDDTGAIVTQVEVYRVKPQKQLTKAQRTIYKKSKGNGKLKVLSGGTSVTVVKKPTDGRWKVKCGKGTGYMEPSALDFVRQETIPAAYEGIERTAPSYQTRPQIFRIVDVEKSESEITVFAYPIAAADLLYNLTTYNHAEEVSCADALHGIIDGCISPHDFEAHTNVATRATGSVWKRVNPTNALLDPENGLAALFGVKIFFDNFEIFALADPGVNRGSKIEYGDNMRGIRWRDSIGDTVTRIIPVGETKDGKELLLNGQIYVDSPNIDHYPMIMSQELKCSDCKVGTNGVTTAIARARMRAQAEAVFTSGGDLPTLELDIDFITLGDSEEFAQYRELDRFFLHDYVTVAHTGLDLFVTMKSVSCTYRIERDRVRVIAMQFGMPGRTLANVKQASWQMPSGISGSKIADGTVGGAQLGDLVMSARHLQAESVYTDALQARVITSEKIVAGAVTADTIAANAITAAKIQAGAVTADTIAANAITAAKIAADAIDATKIKANSITADQLKAGLITADCGLIETGAIGTAQIADGSITTAKIVELNADVIKSGTIKTDLLLLTGDDGVVYKINATSSGLSKSELTDDKYKQYLNGTVIVAKSITADQLAAKTITANEIAANTITTAQINTTDLFASAAFIAALKTTEITSAGDTITIIAGKADNAKATADAVDGKATSAATAAAAASAAAASADSKATSAASAAASAESKAQTAREQVDIAVDVAVDAWSAADAAQNAADSAQSTADTAQGGVDTLQQYVQIRRDGVYICDEQQTSTMHLTSGAVEIGQEGLGGYARFDNDSLQFGNYELRMSADGGLVFKMKE